MKLLNNSTETLLNYFFEFLNFDLDLLNFDNLVSVSMAYVRFAFHGDAEKSKERYERLTRPAFDQSDDKLEEIKQFLNETQKPLKGILNKIHHPSNSKLSLTQKGVRSVTLQGGAFIQTFQVANQPSKKLDLELEIPYIESVLTDIIINGNLLPEMFNQCDECSGYFYQNTKREMKFCSQKCSNTNRQREFQINRRGLASTDSGITNKELENIKKKTDQRNKRLKENEINKMRRKLPLWARKQNQINSKILTLFLKMEDQGLSRITEQMIAERYDGKPSEFKRNFTQMKMIADKNHGKVFHVKGDVVKIWEPVLKLVQEYKEIVLGNNR